MTPVSEARILVVDDEELIRNTCSAMLDALGWEAEAVSDAEGALAAMAAAPNLAIIDLNLEGMGGMALATLIKERAPSCKILLSSGYDVASAGAQDAPCEGFIQKPYSLASLGAAVRKVLGE